MFDIKQGIDIVDIRRINKICKIYGKKFENRIFSNYELKILNLNKKILKKKIEKISGRFALKEAFSKALGTGISKIFSYHDVEIVDNKNGSPAIIMNKSFNKILKADDLSISCSISHEKDYAIGIVTIIIK
tara:strand:+ start:959 stop:1351 length:393 start_codon:yes stop_codon:yes gene_type:complete